MAKRGSKIRGGLISRECKVQNLSLKREFLKNKKIKYSTPSRPMLNLPLEI